MTITDNDNQTVPKHNNKYETTSNTDDQQCNTKKECCLQANKYLSLIEKVEKRIVNNDRWYSLEFFPPRTKNGAENLIGCFQRMAGGCPLFCNVTWHPAGDPAGTKETSSMMIANAMLNYCATDTMLHIACYGVTKETMMEYLSKAKDFGIRNLLALRGDPPPGEEWDLEKGDFRYASDLVKFIRLHFQNYFVICVAGYPQVHPDAKSYEDDLFYLKEKVDSGADFIITQLFFQAETFLKFQSDCRAIGITCPIIPGIFPIQGYSSLRNITRLAKLDVPKYISNHIDPIKDNDDAIRNFGIEMCLDLCRKLLDSDQVNGLHFYTLNREHTTVEILKRIGLWLDDRPLRELPWKKTSNSHIRLNENVRPIFWNIRPKSYIHRTFDWNQYPNGRWNIARTPSFRKIHDYHVFYMGIDATEDELLDEWGRELTCEQDVWKMFVNYISGKTNSYGKIVRHFPWVDEGISFETKLIQNYLIKYNQKGILTINSQPAFNGMSSSDPNFGWGVANGYIYQKAYLEFFTSNQNIPTLINIIKQLPRVNYHIVNKSGTVNETNTIENEPIAVTWGVFPGKEIIQPTIVDSASFMIWKDEAFSLWTEHWGHLYERNSLSYSIIENISNTYCLVYLVDNDYPDGSCLWSILDSIFE